MTKEELEIASEYYAHNNFEMHETNSYKELKRGFEAEVKYTNQVVIEELERAKTTKSWFYVNDRIEELKQEIERYESKRR
tara:strand:- start:359 stop:598 length:240 start_codon:yes stop_codon:yes gene_type:complete